ncbi:AgrD family cyclic lactone autoinducer peptide [Lactiplantibacillus plantarum]|uniref:AgrD family cyclic lactone autoinducer peptide n=1 Tax=Lactiplantibacillus plantarum TaxID=1590 RepID=UPI0009B5943D|nr:cyclic lactone autoinducer peptide [Lactiplantibacillus plantarum]
MIVSVGVKIGEKSTQNCCCLAMYEPKIPTILLNENSKSEQSQKNKLGMLSIKPIAFSN